MSNSKSLPIRFPADVKAWIEQQAQINGSSQNSEVIRALRAAMSQNEKQTST